MIKILITLNDLKRVTLYSETTYKKIESYKRYKQNKRKDISTVLISKRCPHLKQAAMIALTAVSLTLY